VEHLDGTTTSWRGADIGRWGEIAHSALISAAEGDSLVIHSIGTTRPKTLTVPPGDSDQVLVVPLEPASPLVAYEGRVLSAEGQYVEGAVVEFGSRRIFNGLKGVGFTRTDRTGSFALVRPSIFFASTTELTLRAGAMGYVPVESRVPPEGSSGLVFRLERERWWTPISVRCLLPDGRPLAGAEVAAYRSGRWKSKWSFTSVPPTENQAFNDTRDWEWKCVRMEQGLVRVISDTNGVASFPPHAPGTLELRSMHGFHCAFLRFEVPDSREHFTLDLRFEKGRTIRGFTALRGPIGLDDWAGFSWRDYVGSADAEGEFSVHGLPLSPVRIRIRDEQSGSEACRDLPAVAPGTIQDLGELR
jgi:hypothetical protein